MPPPPANGSPASRLQMQLHLHDLQQNATDLRKQLSQLRNMQVRRVLLDSLLLLTRASAWLERMLHSYESPRRLV